MTSSAMTLQIPLSCHLQAVGAMRTSVASSTHQTKCTEHHASTYVHADIIDTMIDSNSMGNKRFSHSKLPIPRPDEAILASRQHACRAAEQCCNGTLQRKANANQSHSACKGACQLPCKVHVGCSTLRMRACISAGIYLVRAGQHRAPRAATAVDDIVLEEVARRVTGQQLLAWCGPPQT